MSLRCERGALSLWFALSLVFLVGSLAFAVDYARLQIAKSNAHTIAASTVKMISANATVLTDAELQQVAQDYVASQIRILMQSSFVDIILQAVSVEKEITDAGFLFSVSVTSKLSYALLPLIGFEDAFAFKSKSSAILAPQTVDVVVVADNQNISVNTLYLNSINYLIDQFEQQTNIGNNLRLGHALSISAQVNVAPRANWVDETWPEEILPPFVAGVTDWTGPLADQHWCILPRDGAASADYTPPDIVPFKTSLEFDQTTDVGGNIVYAIRENPHCPVVPIAPLSASWSDHRYAVTLPFDEPAFILERGLLWAGRVLADNWASAWPVQNQNAELRQKKIILFIGSSAADMNNSASELMSVCGHLKEQGMALFIVDISQIVENRNLLGTCTALAGYLSVQTRTDFETAIADFATSLLRFKITEVR